MGWRVRAVRGATTVSENNITAIREAVHELLDELELYNSLDMAEVVSVTFSVTPDLDAVFPAAIARERNKWDTVPLIDVQHMAVAGSLQRCIRFLIHFNTPDPNQRIHHPYLRGARHLRPDWVSAQTTALKTAAEVSQKIPLADGAAVGG
ncbi:MAG: chorismate mutase [Cyanobacteria bacterium P01_D01_bin.73]